MKVIYKNITLAALALGAVACTQEDDFASSYLNDPDAVRITAQVGTDDVTGGFTRSNPFGSNDVQINFNSGDQISLAAETQAAVVYQLDDNGWKPVGTDYLKWQSDEMNFTAYYPVTAGTDAQNFTVPTDQSKLENLQAADYMTYSGTQSKDDNKKSVSLAMQRKTARIFISNLTLADQFDGGNYSVTGIKVHANTKGYADGEPVTGDITVEAFNRSDMGEFYALLAPTTENTTATFMTVTVSDGTTTQELDVRCGIPATEAGKSYIYSLFVGKSVATVNGISVTDWTDGILAGGEAEEIEYLTFTAKSEQTFMIRGNTSSYTPPEYMQYSVGENEWTSLVAYEEITFGGDKGNLRLRGKSHTGTAINFDDYVRIKFENPNVKVACSGDIRTLVDYTNYKNANTSNARFCSLFNGCTVLETAPTLPATNLATNCYDRMFSGCTALTNAPELPATTLAEECYNEMFYGCTALETAPTLPATNLEKECYYSMFWKCTALKTAPDLAATNLAVNCCYNMFRDCSALTNAPTLSATTLVDCCYQNMFKGCSNLSSVTMLATDVSDSGGLFEWLNDTASSGILYVANESMKSNQTITSNKPDGWEVKAITEETE